jgi:ATP-dependent helicase HrpB
LLAQEVIAGRLILKQWNHATDQWLIRLNCLGAWCPELELPSVTEADRHHLIEQICHGAISYKDLKERPVAGVVRSWLSSAQQDLLDRHAPERVSLPNGRQPKATYAMDAPPHIALRIQELYDVKESPRVALGRVAVVVHILAPNMRPVQVTQDLAAFWSVHYPKLKQELHRKYPKHEWR